MSVAIGGGLARGAGSILIACATVLGVQAPAIGAQDVNPAWHLDTQPILRVGGHGDSLEELFESVAHALPMGDGVVVADAGLRNVRRFDADGDVVWSSGREGEGPGEFATISGVWRESDGAIGIWDGTLDRVTRLSGEDGQVLETTRVTAGSGMGNVGSYMGRFEDGTLLLASLAWGQVEGNPQDRVLADRWTIARFDGDGSQIARITEAEGMRRLNRNPLPFTALPYSAVFGDSLFIIDDYGDRIAVLDEDGATARTFSVGLPVVDGDDLVSDLRNGVEVNGRTLYLEYMASSMGEVLVDSVPLVAGTLIDARGLLWVKPHGGVDDALWLRGRARRPAGGGPWLVFSRDGIPVASVRMPEDFTPLTIEADRVVGVSVDAYGVEAVAMYGLSRR